MRRKSQENCIEWLTGDDHATCTFAQRKYITKIKRIIKKRPEDASILAVNSDGSIVAHISLRALHLYVLGSKNSDLYDDSEEEGEDDEGCSEGE